MMEDNLLLKMEHEKIREIENTRRIKIINITLDNIFSKFIFTTAWVLLMLLWTKCYVDAGIVTLIYLFSVIGFTPLHRATRND